MLLAEITDTHLMDGGVRAYGTVETRTHLASAVSTIAGLTPKPDALLVAGDISEDGTEGSYALFRDMVAPLGMPTYVIPGNHDSRALMRAAFVADGYMAATGPLDYAVVTSALSHSLHWILLKRESLSALSVRINAPGWVTRSPLFRQACDHNAAPSTFFNRLKDGRNRMPRR